MSGDEVARMFSVRRVLREMSRGRGMSSAVCVSFAGSAVREEREAARMILLGAPLELALRGWMTGSAGGIIRYVATQARVSAREASRRGERLSILYERWSRAKQRRAMESKVMAFRSLLFSVILGSTSAIIAELAPILSSFQLSLTQQPREVSILPYLGVLFALPGATLLGLFVSRRRAYVNLIAAAASYAVAAYLFAPLALPLQL